MVLITKIGFAVFVESSIRLLKNKEFLNQIYSKLDCSNSYLFRECVSTGAADVQTRRSLGHYLLHPQILRLLVLLKPGNFEAQSSLLQNRLHPQIQIPNACPVSRYFLNQLLALFYVHILTSACYNFDLTIVGLSPIIFSSVAKAYDHKSMGERKKHTPNLFFLTSSLGYFYPFQPTYFLTFDYAPFFKVIEISLYH